jgi:hypothetical protein
MEWGYAPGLKKAHCFVKMENPDLNISLCHRVVSFNIHPVDEIFDEAVTVCFNCLLVFIQKGEVKP